MSTRSDNAPRRRGRLGLWLIILLALVGAGIGAWEGYLEDRFLPKRFGVVEEGLIYRSGKIHPKLVKQVLQRKGIQVVIDMTSREPDHPYREAEMRAARELGIEYHQYSMKGDGTGAVEHYADAVARVHDSAETGQVVLVHCAAGTQRTGGVVAIYRLLVQGRSTEEIVAELRRYDWEPEDDQLLAYLNGHMPQLAELLVERGVLDESPEAIPSLHP